MTAVAGAMLDAATGLTDPEYAQRLFPIVGKSILGLFLSALILGIAGLLCRKRWHPEYPSRCFCSGY